MKSWTNFIDVSRITVEINLLLPLSRKEAVKVMDLFCCTFIFLVMKEHKKILCMDTYIVLITYPIWNNYGSPFVIYHSLH